MQTSMTIEEMVRGLEIVPEKDADKLFDEDLRECGDVNLQTHLVEFVAYGADHKGRQLISMSVTKLHEYACNWSYLGNNYAPEDETTHYIITSLEDGYRRVMNYMIDNADSSV